MKVWKVDDVKFSTRRKTNMGIKSAHNNTASFKYWEKDPRILAVGTSLTDQSLDINLLESLCPNTKVNKLTLFTISPNGNISLELNILEKLATEVDASEYDLCMIEVGVNEVSNCNSKLPDWQTNIADRLINLIVCVKNFEKDFLEASIKLSERKPNYGKRKLCSTPS